MFFNSSLRLLKTCVKLCVASAVFCVGSRNNTGHSAPRQKRLVSKLVALRPQKRSGILGTGKRGEGGGELGGGGRGGVSGSSVHSDPQKTEEAVDHRQNNNYVKAVRSNLCAPLIAVQLL